MVQHKDVHASFPARAASRKAVPPYALMVCSFVIAALNTGHSMFIHHNSTSNRVPHHWQGQQVVLSSLSTYRQLRSHRGPLMPIPIRFVLANTEVLHDKITILANRVRTLEDALEDAHSNLSAEVHPLLSNELRALKRPLERESPEEQAQEQEQEVVDSINVGSLYIFLMQIFQAPD